MSFEKEFITVTMTNGIKAMIRKRAVEMYFKYKTEFGTRLYRKGESYLNIDQTPEDIDLLMGRRVENEND